MGIKGLNKIIKKEAPNAYQDVHISEYAYKKIAVDISLYVCKFKAVCGDRWISAFINLVTCLRRNNVHCVFVYDTGAPPEKEREREERSAQRAKATKNIEDLEEGLKNYIRHGTVSDYLEKTSLKLLKGAPKRLMAGGFDSSTAEINIPVEQIRELIEKKKSQQLGITPADFELTKALFDVINVPYLDAPLEAETTCVDLALQGEVDAVLTEDTDVLAYGTPVFLSKFNTSTGICSQLIHKEMLEEMEISNDSFLDLCIMCGTDYNKNIKGMGPVSVYKNVLTHGSIEAIGKALDICIDSLTHVRVRELFREYEKVDYKVRYCGKPDFGKLEEFTFKHNIQCNVGAIRHHFTQVVILEGLDKKSVCMPVDDARHSK